jgi:phosphoglycerol transferase MdoB-like AlkP superfamily enzyme
MRVHLRDLKFVAAQFLLLFVGYFLCRSIFTIINIQYFQELSFLKIFQIEFFALRFDLSTIFAINFIYLLFFFAPFPLFKEKIRAPFLQFLFLLINSIAFLFEIADWGYFQYNQKRSTADLLDLLTRKGDFVNQFPSLIVSHSYILISSIIFISLFIFTNRKIINYFSKKRNEEPTIAYKSIQFVLICLLSIVAIRGGIQYVPIGLRNAVALVENGYSPIILNTPFSILSTLSNKQLKPENYYSERELNLLINNTKGYANKPFQKKNVVFIILESFSKEFTGIGGLKSYTPFLDSLMNHSFVCKNAFANGYRSAEGIPSIISGIPSIQEEPFTTSAYGVNKITTVVNLLSKKGYSSGFYHGGTNGTMSFDLFAKNAGFDKYIGRTEYNNDQDYDGVWGIWDEPFLQFCANDFSNQLKEPFIGSIFTISSHPPYKIPSKYTKILPNGTLPIHKTIAYTDLSLRNFFQTAKTKPWFQNTLFIIVSDHCSPLSEDDYYHYKQGRFAIPIIYYCPNDKELVGITNTLTQQIDILPSVMDYLGYPNNFFAFGNSIFSASKSRFTIQQWSGNQLWTFNNRFLRCSGEIPEGLFDTEKDKLCTDNLLNKNDSLKDETIKYYQAFRQSYINAMNKNSLWIK